MLKPEIFSLVVQKRLQIKKIALKFSLQKISISRNNSPKQVKSLHLRSENKHENF